MKKIIEEVVEESNDDPEDICYNCKRARLGTCTARDSGKECPGYVWDE